MSAGDPRAPCAGGCGRPAIDGKATCGDAACGPTTGRGLEQLREEIKHTPGYRAGYELGAAAFGPEDNRSSLRRLRETLELCQLRRRSAQQEAQAELAPGEVDEGHEFEPWAVLLEELARVVLVRELSRTVLRGERLAIPSLGPDCYVPGCGQAVRWQHDGQVGATVLYCREHAAQADR